MGEDEPWFSAEKVLRKAELTPSQTEQYIKARF